ncbi:MAG: ATP-binding protein [Egibacteraceae bacterium]
MTFFGRAQEMARLGQELEEVQTAGQGRFVVVRGRRQVGKSRLVEEFLAQHEVPSVYFQATKGRLPDKELAIFAQAVAGSALAAAPLVRAGASFSSWDGALAVIGATATGQAPAVVVLDEVPYLFEQDLSVEGALQTAWDRHLRDRPVLLIMIGSDFAVMSALLEYGRPLFGRPTREMIIEPLSPADVADALGLSPPDALDAHLVLGGFPLLINSWRGASSVREYLFQQLEDPTGPLLVVGERILAAEFPPQAQARLILSVIGAGERTFTTIAQRSGISGTSLTRALDILMEKRVVQRMAPLSSRPSRLARYAVADPYLRFWLRFLERGLELVQRGRGDLLLGRIDDAWSAYRGKAVEPVIREALRRLLPLEGLGDATAVGSYWTRSQDVEVDIVGADSPRAPAQVRFLGSIKWRDGQPFGAKDLSHLLLARERVPGAADATPLLGVSGTGFETDMLDARLGPADLIEAWRPRTPGSLSR